MDHHTVEMCIVVRRSVFQVFFWEEMDVVCSVPKKKRAIQTVTSNKSRSQGLVMVWGCVCALGKGNLHLCDGTINAEKYIEILEQHMLPSRRHPFHGSPCILQQDNAKPHSAYISKAWLRKKGVRVLDCPAVLTCPQ